MMKKLISFLLSITLCSSMMTIFPAASWDLNEEQAVEGAHQSYVQAGRGNLRGTGTDC